MKKLFVFVTILFLVACQKIDQVGVLVPPLVTQDPYLPSVQVNVGGKNRKLHVRTFGNQSNPVLFFLHGSYSDSRAYKNICEGLSDSFFVVIWDQRGCGLSERIEKDEFNNTTILEEINAMKKIYSPTEPVYLIGQSWGGGLASYYTASFSQNVKKLLLIEPMPLAGDDMMEIYNTIIDFSFFDRSWNSLARHSEAISPRDHEQIDYRAMMILKSTMTRGYHCDGDNPPEWPIHRVGGMLESYRNTFLGNPISGFNYNFTEGLKNYESRTLILGGSCSSLGYDMQLKYNSKYFKNLEIKEVKNAGHRMNIEKYDEVIRLIRNFLFE